MDVKRKRSLTRTELIAHASAAVQKTFGEGRSVRAILDLAFPSVWASTGSLVLDRIIAGRVPGGMPFGPKRGKVVHVFGKWSLGKSVLVDCVGANVQKPPINGLCLVSETEGSRDPHFAEAVGWSLDEVEIQRPDTIEEMNDLGMEWIEDVRKRDREIPIFWAVDSLETVESGQTFHVKMTGKTGGAYEFGGGRPGKIGAMLRKMASLCSKAPTSVLIINQIRARPGVMFGKPTGSTSGNAPHFLASCEIELSSSPFGVIAGADGRAKARWVHAEAVKNKISAPFAKGEFLIDFNRGIRRWPGVAEMLADEGVIAVEREPRKKYITGSEFTVVKTGEVLPLTDFVAWCEREKVLEA